MRDQDFVTGLQSGQHFHLARSAAAQLHAAALQFGAHAHIQARLHAGAFGQQQCGLGLAQLQAQARLITRNVGMGLDFCLLLLVSLLLVLLVLLAQQEQLALVSTMVEKQWCW